MENAHATEYLRSVKKRFTDAKQIAERAIAQLSDEQLFWTPNAETNSIAVIIKHMSGNMISRWTDFFDTDGEKPSRNRDGEFIMEETVSRSDLLAVWEKGWECFLGTLASFTQDDLLRTIYIRKEPHSVIDAIERQMYHYSYHVGQIVYVAKLLRDDQWQSLTIPRKR